MKFHRLTLLPAVLILGLALGFPSLGAQEVGTVTGQVVNAETGVPLAEAQMVIVGTNIGTLTNDNGRYLITRVPAGQREVRAVLLGFAQQVQTITVTAGETTVIDFNLSPTAISLEALVVSSPTGREQRARELGSKVSQLNVAEMNTAPITTFSDVLSGRSEGVVMQDVNGTTGTATRIRIRGANSVSLSNDPLIFLDGVPINASSGGGFGVGGQDVSRLNDINPNDIENVEIVKGPAASALYGTAAANGVVLITTKRGRPGNTQWTFFAEMGALDDTNDYPINYETYSALDPSQPLFLNGVVNTDAYSLCSNRAAAAGDCTQDETLAFNTMEDSRTTPYSTGNRGRYGASVRGGTEQVRYFVSAQNETEQGVISYNKQEKTNLRANLDAAISETVDLSVSFGYTKANLGLNNNDNSIFSPIINGILGRAYYVPPTEGEFPAGVPNDDNYGFGFNQYELENLVVYNDIDRLTLSSNVRFRPFSWLTLNATGGLDLTDTHNHEDLQPGKLPIAESYANGYRDSERQNRYLYSALFSGVGTFHLRDDLLSTTTVGAQYDQNTAQSTECYGSSLVPGTKSCGTTSALYDVDENFTEIRTVGGYIQEELAWRDKVFLAGAVRGDDNSAFGADFGFVYYPSASLSWVIGEEDWFPQLDWLSGLRLRSAYGTSGLRPGMRDAVTLYEPTTVATGAGDEPGVALDVTGNTQLKPERSTEYELGFDTGFLDDRLGVEFTYYRKKSEDALISKPLPGSLGLTTTVFDNLGSIENKGTELALNVEAIRRDMVGLNIGFTNTTLTNEVLELGEGIEPITFNRGLQRHAPTFSAGSFFQQKVSWNDADGNGLLTNDEVTLSDTAVFLGVSLPKWQRTVYADMRISDWINISTLFEGRGGHMTGNDTDAFRCGYRSTRGCAAVGNPNDPLWDQARYIADRYLTSAAGYVEKADFWKWREFTVSFSMPPFVTNYAQQLNGLRLTFAGRNLATWTDYTGLDPETVEGGGGSNFNQSEFNTQPPVRYLMIRLDYTF